MFADYTYFGVTRQLEFVSAAMKFNSLLGWELPGDIPGSGAGNASIPVMRDQNRGRQLRV